MNRFMNKDTFYSIGGYFIGHTMLSSFFALQSHYRELSTAAFWFLGLTEGLALISATNTKDRDYRFVVWLYICTLTGLLLARHFRIKNKRDLLFGVICKSMLIFLLLFIPMSFAILVLFAG